MHHNGDMSFAAWATAFVDSTSIAFQVVDYPNPGRTIADYDSSAPYPGAGSLESFLAEAAKQSKSNWRDKFTGTHAVRYFQENFGMVVP